MQATERLCVNRAENTDLPPYSYSTQPLHVVVQHIYAGEGITSACSAAST